LLHPIRKSDAAFRFAPSRPTFADRVSIDVMPKNKLPSSCYMQKDTIIMIYRLTVECLEGWHYDHESIRIIDIHENDNLYSLFDIVREANGFGFEHAHLFYLG
jgi:hypothetical protein